MFKLDFQLTSRYYWTQAGLRKPAPNPLIGGPHKELKSPCKRGALQVMENSGSPA